MSTSHANPSPANSSPPTVRSPSSGPKKKRSSTMMARMPTTTSPRERANTIWVGAAGRQRQAGNDTAVRARPMMSSDESPKSNRSKKKMAAATAKATTASPATTAVARNATGWSSRPRRYQAAAPKAIDTRRAMVKARVLLGSRRASTSTLSKARISPPMRKSRPPRYARASGILRSARPTSKMPSAASMASSWSMVIRLLWRHSSSLSRRSSMPTSAFASGTVGGPAPGAGD